jgi:hypothetical protein
LDVGEAGDVDGDEVVHGCGWVVVCAVK